MILHNKGFKLLKMTKKFNSGTDYKQQMKNTTTQRRNIHSKGLLRVRKESLPTFLASDRLTSNENRGLQLDCSIELLFEVSTSAR